MTALINKALVAAMGDISRIGIAKLQRNSAQGYNFRGIEAAMNEMSPILVKHGINISARYSDLIVTEQPREGKGPMRFVTLRGAFTFAAEDGSHVVSEVYGESMDSGDKAVVKAQSVAFRTALFQQFVVPTMAMDPEEHDDGDEGSNPDADLLDGFRDASLKGTVALRKHYETTTPTESFWRKHSKALKDAAAKADQDRQGAPA
jgi:hypothetical protein